MKMVRTIDEVRRTIDPTKRVGLVPTMGALHDGHLSLARAARAECETVVLSLFVNPAQFGALEDLTHYPRSEEDDAGLAEREGVDLLFAPDAAELYPEGFATWVDVEETGAEGRARPGHFRGVATVCLKLFNIVRPDVAYFGQKDAQQAAVLRRLVRDLDLAVVLRVLPTVRDPDGLALSSRNAYLSSEERRRALALPRALATRSLANARARLAESGLEVDYVDTLESGGQRILAAAVRVGGTRLIDN